MIIHSTWLSSTGRWIALSVGSLLCLNKLKVKKVKGTKGLQVSG